MLVCDHISLANETVHEQFHLLMYILRIMKPCHHALMHKMINYSAIYFIYYSILFYLIEVPSGYPTNIQAKAYSPTAAILSWTEIECSLRNGPITDYQYMLVDLSSDSIYSGTISTSAISSASYGNIPLLPCVQYKVSMAGMNPAGRGPYSPTILLNVNNESGKRFYNDRHATF